jgi:hypothetical protein
VELTNERDEWNAKQAERDAAFQAKLAESDRRFRRGNWIIAGLFALLIALMTFYEFVL